MTNLLTRWQDIEGSRNKQLQLDDDQTSLLIPNDYQYPKHSNCNHEK